MQRRRQEWRSTKNTQAVWGCKHPRLEAALPTELSVWCLLPPTAPHPPAPRPRKGRHARVSLYPLWRCMRQCLRARICAWITTVAASGSVSDGTGGVARWRGGCCPHHHLFSLCSCKHPTLSCDRRQQRLREGCLLGPAGSDPPAGSTECKASRLNGPGSVKADRKKANNSQVAVRHFLFVAWPPRF